MPTFSELRTKIARKLIDPNNTAVSAADVGGAINDALRFWKQRRLWFNESSTQITLAENVNTISGLPADFLYELPENGFVIADISGIFWPLQKVQPHHFDYSSNANAIGRPFIYTWRNGTFAIYYKTNISYPLNVYYVRNYDPLVNDGDNNDFTNYADQLLIYEALSRLSGEDRQDLEMNNAYAAKADREYESLLQRSRRTVGTGHLSVQTII